MVVPSRAEYFSQRTMRQASAKALSAYANSTVEKHKGGDLRRHLDVQSLLHVSSNLGNSRSCRDAAHGNTLHVNVGIATADR